MQEKCHLVRIVAKEVKPRKTLTIPIASEETIKSLGLKTYKNYVLKEATETCAILEPLDNNKIVPKPLVYNTYYYPTSKIVMLGIRRNLIKLWGYHYHDFVRLKVFMCDDGKIILKKIVDDAGLIIDPA